MIEKSCLVTDTLPNNDICNKFGETWSDIIGDLFSSSMIFAINLVKHGQKL